MSEVCWGLILQASSDTVPRASTHTMQNSPWDHLGTSPLKWDGTTGVKEMRWEIGPGVGQGISLGAIVTALATISRVISPSRVSWFPTFITGEREIERGSQVRGGSSY